MDLAFDALGFCLRIGCIRKPVPTIRSDAARGKLFYFTMNRGSPQRGRALHLLILTVTNIIPATRAFAVKNVKYSARQKFSLTVSYSRR